MSTGIQSGFLIGPIATPLSIRSDGNLLLSMRHQSWVLRSIMPTGAGAGDILWRLGPEGDFTLLGGDPSRGFTISIFRFCCRLKAPGLASRCTITVTRDPTAAASLADKQQLLQPRRNYQRGRVGPHRRGSWQYSQGWYSFWGGSIDQLPNGDVELDSSTVDGGDSRVIQVTPGSSPLSRVAAGHLRWLLVSSYRIRQLYPGVQW